jgi:hypothetical protein
VYPLCVGSYALIGIVASSLGWEGRWRDRSGIVLTPFQVQASVSVEYDRRSPGTHQYLDMDDLDKVSEG